MFYTSPLAAHLVFRFTPMISAKLEHGEIPSSNISLFSIPTLVKQFEVDLAVEAFHVTAVRALQIQQMQKIGN
jgi:hypothetical protein